MDFEELQQVWDSQAARPAYTIDEQALHGTILSKMKKAHHITHISELLTIFVYTGVCIFIVALNLSGRPHYISLYILAAWMFCVAMFVLFGRMRRIRSNRQFDRSIHGHLDRAISIASYQVRLSRLMRWNILPVAGIILSGFREGSKALWIGVCTVLFFILAYVASGFEHGIYKRRRSELYALKKKLEDH